MGLVFSSSLAGTVLFDTGIGFWQYPYPGRLTYADRMMIALLEAQKQGLEYDPNGRLDLDAGEISTQYPENEFPGHAAWLEFPWKLHRFVDKGEETLELYNLKSDSQETTNLHSQEPSRIERMLNHLEDWQIAVMRSLNGKDY